MGIPLVAFGCILLAYAVLVVLLVRRDDDWRSARSTRWAFVHAAFLAFAGVTALVGGVSGGTNRIALLVLGAALIADAALRLIARRAI